MKIPSNGETSQCGILKPRGLMGRVPAIRDYSSGSKPRMHSCEAVWCISCSRFKHCARAPDVAATWPVFDDDASAETRLHDANPRRMEFSKRTPNHLSGCSSRPVTPKIFVSGQLLRA